MVSCVLSVRLCCFHVPSSSVVAGTTASEPPHWSMQQTEIVCATKGKLVSGVFNNNILHVSNFLQPSFLLSQKRNYVSCLSTPRLTQPLMTLKGSICPSQNCAVWAEKTSIAKVIAECGWNIFWWRDFYCSAFQHSSSLFVIFMTNHRNTFKRSFILT